MSRSISEKIHREAANYYRDSMKTATKLYLGIEEWGELSDELRKMDFMFTGFQSHSERSEFMGMEVYMVDADNHIGFGF